MAKAAPFTVVKSYQDGRVGLRVALRSSDWQGPSITMQATATITTTEARELAAALIQQADAEDAKLLKKEAAEARRRKWRDREVAAGRIKVMSTADFFARRP